MAPAAISPADVTIRPLLEADVTAARTAAATALEHLYPEDVSPEEPARRVQSGIARVAHLRRTDPGGCWVAELDGEIIGTALGLIREGVWGFSLFGLLPAAGRAISMPRRSPPPRATCATPRTCPTYRPWSPSPARGCSSSRATASPARATATSQGGASKRADRVALCLSPLGLVRLG